MKILFISDIHGIDTNLGIIENKIKTNNIDLLICLGDLYSNDITSNGVSKFLNKYKDMLICMKGNCDSKYIVDNSNFLITDGISYLNIDNIDMYITHGNIYNHENKPNYKGVLIYGHKHIPSINKDNNMIYICTGSISAPRDNNKPTYVIYENRKFTIYDIDDSIINMIEISK